jgi:hypothetical protein
MPRATQDDQRRVVVARLGLVFAVNLLVVRGFGLQIQHDHLRMMLPSQLDTLPSPSSLEVETPLI